MNWKMLFLVGVAHSLWAAEPTLDQVLARHAAALGGAEKIAAVKSLEMTGQYIYNGLEHDMALFQKEGGRIRLEIDGYVRYGASKQPGKKEIRAYDGRDAWVVSQAQSPAARDLSGPAAAGLIAAAELVSSLAHGRRPGRQIELVGRESVDGASCYRVDLTFAGGMVQRWFLDAESFLPVRTDVEFKDGDRVSVEHWLYDDYREVGGVKLPYYVEKEERLFTRTWSLERVEINPPLEDALFARPPSN